MKEYDIAHLTSTLRHFPLHLHKNSEHMYLKIFRAAWFMSVLVFLAALLLAYAALQEQVSIPFSPAGSQDFVTFSRETFFYSFLGMGAVINVLPYVIRAALKKRIYDPFRTWFHGVLITFHVFLIVSINFIEVFNSGASYNYNSIIFVIYGSICLIVLWAIAWPMYLIYARYFNKQLV